MKVYAVTNWEHHYEKAGTRSVKYTTWFPVSHKHDGKGYRRIMAMPDGTTIYGAWILILAVAAKCPTRGVLVDFDGQVITSEDLSFKTGAPKKVFDNALEVLSSPRIAWLVATDCNASQHVGATGHDMTEQDNTEPPIVPLRGTGETYHPQFLEWWKCYPKKVFKCHAFKAWKKAGTRLIKQHGIEKAAAVTMLLSAVQEFAKSAKAQGDYCPNPATWLNGGGYEDDPAAWQDRGSASKPRGIAQL